MKVAEMRILDGCVAILGGIRLEVKISGQGENDLSGGQDAGSKAKMVRACVEEMRMDAPCEGS
ncbi:hypothetical protein P3S67_015947 [Capsicum chacoense]